MQACIDLAGEPLSWRIPAPQLVAVIGGVALVLALAAVARALHDVGLWQLGWVRLCTGLAAAAADLGILLAAALLWVHEAGDRPVHIEAASSAVRP